MSIVQYARDDWNVILKHVQCGLDLNHLFQFASDAFVTQFHWFFSHFFLRADSGKTHQIHIHNVYLSRNKFFTSKKRKINNLKIEVFWRKVYTWIFVPWTIIHAANINGLYKETDNTYLRTQYEEPTLLCAWIM